MNFEQRNVMRFNVAAYPQPKSSDMITRQPGYGILPTKLDLLSQTKLSCQIPVTKTQTPLSASSSETYVSSFGSLFWRPV